MQKENDYVDHFYTKYEGRVALGVGYGLGLTEIYPLVFENSKGESIGILALGVILDEIDVVHIYHLGAFIANRKDGSKMLKELCCQADQFNITLSVSAVSIPNGNGDILNTAQLIKWYESYGFKGETGLLRIPNEIGP